MDDDDRGKPPKCPSQITHGVESLARFRADVAFRHNIRLGRAESPPSGPWATGKISFGVCINRSQTGRSYRPAPCGACLLPGRGRCAVGRPLPSDDGRYWRGSWDEGRASGGAFPFASRPVVQGE